MERGCAYKVLRQCWGNTEYSARLGPYLHCHLNSSLPAPIICPGYPAVSQRQSEECLRLPVKCNPQIHFPSEEVRMIPISGNLETNFNCSYRERKPQIQDERWL